MFGFAKKHGKVKRLDEIIQEMEMNMSNNYKDAAQENLKELQNTLEELESAGEISGAKLSGYQQKLAAYKEKLKNYTHKDQKTTW